MQAGNINFIYFIYYNIELYIFPMEITGYSILDIFLYIILKLNLPYNILPGCKMILLDLVEEQGRCQSY
jgi:hypothetical protein